MHNAVKTITARPANLLAIQVFALLLLHADGNYALGDPAPMCWMLDRTNTPMQCPTGLAVDWMDDFRVPSRIYVGVPVLVRISLNVTLQTFQDLERMRLNSKTTPNMTALEKWQRCTQANTPCPAGQRDADSCCLFHVNVHSCQNKPGMFCGPWVGNDGQLATHTPAQTGYAGTDGRSLWDFNVKLFWEGSYTVIAHARMAGFHFAIGITTEVRYGTSACSDPFQVPARSGPCENCTLGTQPLSQGIPPGAKQLTDDEALATGRNPLCISCPPGMASDDGRLCRTCLSGSFSEAAGSTACTRCPAGRHAYDEGSRSCRACLAGSYAAPGSTVCSSCPRGRYRPAPPQSQGLGLNSTDRGDETDCLACPAPYTTLEIHAKNVSECACPSGSYELPKLPGVMGVPGCAQCTVGMRCPQGGLSAPLQAAGYFVQLIEQPVSKGKLVGEYEAYRCLSDHCPAAQAGVCSEGREGLACGQCKEFYFPIEDGKCQECGGQDYVPAFLGLLALVAFFCGLFIWAGADAARQRLSTLGLLCIVGQVVVTVQLVSSITMMQFKLVDPLMSLADSLQIMSLNVDTIKLQCVFGSDVSVAKYAATLASYPCFAAVLGLVFALLRCVTKRKLGVYDIVNSLGLVLMVLFLPVTVVCLQPFRCVSNPSGRSSVSAAASVLCGESTHQLMLGIGALGTLVYPVTVLGSVIGVTWIYPRMVAMGRGVMLLRCFRFLFQRFTPKAYYYGLVYLSRSTLVALMPVFFPEQGYYLPFALTVTVTVVALLEAVVWPWRTHLANLNDLACGFFLIMVLAVTNALADLERSQLEKQLSIILTICIVVGVALVLVTSALAVVKVCERYKKRFGVFLTHHKGGAGSLARLIKLRLQPKMRSEIFLDSDNLDDLESLFDTVRCNVAHLVAILTEETLRRPWCAGELVMALKNGVPVTIAAHPGLQLPGEEELSNICSIWSPEDLHPLHHVGVRESDVVECYRKLSGLPRIKLPRSLASDDDLEVFNEAIELVASTCTAAHAHQTVPNHRGLPAGMKNSTSRSHLSAQEVVNLIIITNVADPEASAAGFILRELCGRSSHDRPTVVFQPEDLEQAGGTSAVLIVVLNKGCLESPDFVRLLLAAQGKWAGNAAIVAVVADKGFCFPSKEEVAKKLSPTMAQVLTKDFGMVTSTENVIRCYSAVLHILALVFSCHLGMDILNTEVAMICKRVSKALSQLQAGSGAKISAMASLESQDAAPTSSARRPNFFAQMLTMASRSPSDLTKAKMSERALRAPVSVLDMDASGGEDLEEGELAI